jgi:hypothetical protein
MRAKNIASPTSTVCTPPRPPSPSHATATPHPRAVTPGLLLALSYRVAVVPAPPSVPPNPSRHPTPPTRSPRAATAPTASLHPCLQRWIWLRAPLLGTTAAPATPSFLVSGSVRQLGPHTPGGGCSMDGIEGDQP